MNRKDIPELLEWFNGRLESTLFPMLAARYPDKIKSPDLVRAHDAFIVKYDATTPEDNKTVTTPPIDTTAAGVSANYKYWGAAAVGNSVFFAPYNEDNVGVLDTTTSSFSTIDTTAAGVTASNKYNGAAAVGQSLMMSMYETLFSKYNLSCAQVLVTESDISDPETIAQCPGLDSIECCGHRAVERLLGQLAHARRVARHHDELKLRVGDERLIHEARALLVEGVVRRRLVDHEALPLGKGVP